MFIVDGKHHLLSYVVTGSAHGIGIIGGAAGGIDFGGDGGIDFGADEPAIDFGADAALTNLQEGPNYPGF